MFRSKKVMTLDDLKKKQEEEEEGQSFYAGGEKSGMAVQGGPARRPGANPLVDEILSQARKQTAEAELRAQHPAQYFQGRAQKLSDDTPPAASQPAAAFPPGTAGSGRPSPPPPSQPADAVMRVLIFWADGFSFEGDSQMRSYEDPRNQRLLQSIQSGLAPLAELGLQPGENVEMKVAHLLEERWSASRQAEIIRSVKGEGEEQRPKVKPFTGAGHRLGDMPSAAAAAANQAPRGSADTSAGFDASQPTTRLQIRLANGTRHTIQFNPNQRVASIFQTVAELAGTPSTQLTLLSGRPPVVLDRNAPSSLAEAGLLASAIFQQ